MSRLDPRLLVLDKGLDLQTAKIVAEAGTSSDVLNYEQVDFQGQKRIDGYVRYDGSPLSSFDDFLIVPSPVITVEQGPYTLAYNGDNLFGVVVDELPSSTIVVVIDYNHIPDGAEWGRDSSLTVDEHYDLLLTYQTNLRSLVEELPGPIIGLHWFKDRLYAVVDIEDYSAADTRVGSFGNASLFESRTIKQVLEEDAPGPYDFGWRFVHQGWLVYFENGQVLFGDLAAKNQNRQGVGVEGPTTITGNNGSPLILTQKVAITNSFTQVNGWKSSDTPTTYTLNPEDVTTSDTEYAYADAFVSWDGTTGVVTAPGSDGTGLVEYPATDTIEVDV